MLSDVRVLEDLGTSRVWLRFELWLSCAGSLGVERDRSGLKRSLFNSTGLEGSVWSANRSALLFGRVRGTVEDS